MKPLTKNLILLGGALIAGSFLIGLEKVSKLTAIFDKMTIKPNSLPRNVRASLSQIKFNIDIILSNPTKEDFAVSGYVATLSQVVVYYKGTFLGVAQVAIDQISVPAYQTLVLKNIEIVVATTTILNNVSTLATAMDNMTVNLLNDLEFVGVVEVLGSYYEIGN